MAYRDIPKGAGFGRDENQKLPGTIDPDWVMQFGSRAQRRDLLRQARRYARQSIPGAGGFADILEQRASRRWLVMPPDGGAFSVEYRQRVTATDVVREFPGSSVVAIV